MNVLFPIAEAHPLYKIGGLGDVGGSLPQAILKLGTDIRLALPKHPEIILPKDGYKEAELEITYHGQSLPVTVLRTMLPGTNVPVYLFQEDRYLSQNTDAADNHADKFAVFSLAVATWINEATPYWQPQIVHCHDWHTALIPVLLMHKFGHKNIKTVITIHNLAYQGITQTPVAKHLDLDPEACSILSWDLADGDTNILLEGLLHADRITTVSPRYAKEILTDDYGEKINSILESKKTKIYGILNGLDTVYFNPQTDPHLSARYTKQNWQAGKTANRRNLYHQLNLPFSDSEILISFIGRVDPYQKGIGLIVQAIKDGLLSSDQTRFIFLGTGDPGLEQQLHQAATGQPKTTIITRFDEPLAHQLYAASHLSLIPSRFEPCGLVQLIAMRYGTLPIVRATGGLADTVKHLTNGFVFDHYEINNMAESITTAIHSLQDEQLYPRMVDAAMSADYSWKTSALEYQQLYEDLLLSKSTTTPHD